MRKLAIAFPLIMFLLFITLYAQDEQSDKDSSFYIQSGWEFVSSGKINEANANFQKALESNPENTEALEGLAKTFMYLSKHQEAEEAFSRLLELEPDNIDAMVGLAQIYSWTERYEESIALYTKALELEPENTEAKTGLAETYNWGGYYQESISQYEQILTENPQDMKTYKDMIKVHEWNNKLEAAKTIYEKALNIWPENIDLRLGLAKTYTWMANWSKAEEEYNKVLETEPDNLEALEGLANTYVYLDKHLEAEEAFNKILQLEPDNIDAMVGLAQIYSWTGRYEEAITLYKKALEFEPENTEAKKGLAETYNWGGYYQESISRYQELLGEDPRDVRAYRGLAEVYIWDDRLNEAERIYSDALKSMPNNIDLRLGLARIYTWMARWPKAEEEYNKVIEIAPDNIEALKGIKNVKQALLPKHDFILTYISEQDDDSWKAHTTTLGYKQTRFLNNGNSLYAAYYFSALEETDKDDKTGNTVELGGKYNVNSHLSLLGYIDMRTYSNSPNFFAGGGVDAILRYYDKNTITLGYDRELDVLDEISRDSYGAESNIYLGNYFLLTNSYTYGDFSDGNKSTDSYHNLTFLVLKSKPDMNIGIGYRRRDFDECAEEYYSPMDLESWIYSFYIGRTYEKYTPYFIFKFIDNSDDIDNYYYLGGVDYRINDTCSITGEISYFDTTADYSALTIMAILGIKF